MIISPNAPYQPSAVRRLNMELGALGISFPHQENSANVTVDQLSKVPVPGAAKVDLFSAGFKDSQIQTSHKLAVEVHVNVLNAGESVDGLATSSMTLMDPEVCSEKSSPSSGEVAESFDDHKSLKPIGEDIVLQYILDSMKSDVRRNRSLPAIPYNEKPLPEPRHRRDPSYEELPSISLITATPNAPPTDRGHFLLIPPQPSPPFPLLVSNESHNALFYPTNLHQPAIRAPFTMNTQAATSVVSIRAFNGSFFHEFCDDHRLSLSLGMPTGPPAYESFEPEPVERMEKADALYHQRVSKSSSIIRRVSTGIFSLFRLRRGAAEMRHDASMEKKVGHVDSQRKPCSNGAHLYSLQSARATSVSFEKSV